MWESPIAIHPNSLANLMPAWSPGHSGNGTKAPNHGASILQYLNDLGIMPESKVRAIAVDPDAPIAKRKAAKSHLRSLSDEIAKNGRAHALEDLAFQVEHTNGKAVQRVQVTRTEVQDPAALRVELLRVLADAPALLESLGLTVGGVLGGEAEGADATGGSPNRATDSG